ncbi:DUF427 domain-containing protein [Herbaspirillum sp. LeCh32-8]|uniref:DUF427 domain-containing protein n=1 Tax=Herbaspirillum sp. LeCh32-8 TaxID=2821356 RepID=UPI001AE1410E|nr:DUF427 domain-containing protein [Herbaspirillum sp. LeCh32-8]MBP0598311.1 DUF427 domain-containing protein [Herbaspirillum sp. LeCh32-8]
MSKSPGHQQHPDHKVEEQRVAQRVTVRVGEQEVAGSDDVIAVHETDCPTRYYFPRTALKSQRIQPSATTSHCPFKGSASYYDLMLEDRSLHDAVWSYEDPYDEHRALQGRLAFYDDKLPEIKVAVD